MTNPIKAKVGKPKAIITHQTDDSELQMIKSLIQDICTIKNESNESSHLGWATFFLGAAFSAFLTIVTLSGDSPHYNLIWSLIFMTSCLGSYFLWNWNTNKRKEDSALKLKKEKLNKIFQKLESRIETEDSTSLNEYDEIFQESHLRLRSL